MISSDDIDAFTPEPKLVAFTGPAGCGKSTAAAALWAAGWTRIKFASTLKDMCRAMGLTEDQIEGCAKEVPIEGIGLTPRYIMQTLGTDWGRRIIHPDLWVEITRKKARDALAQGEAVVIDDCRFENEAQMVRDLGGIVVRIEGRGKAVEAHESEAGCSFDETIINSGPEWHFAEKVMRRFGD